jgi:hypothetical protein
VTGTSVVYVLIDLFAVLMIGACLAGWIGEE